MERSIFQAVAICFGAIFLFFLIQYDRRLVYQKLYKALFMDKDYTAYEKLLGSKHIKAVLGKKQWTAFRLDGYILARKVENIEPLLNELEHMILTKKDRIVLYQKKVDYYIYIRDIRAARNSYEMLRQSVELAGNRPKDLSILEQVEQALELCEQGGLK